MTQIGKNWSEHGTDFASTLGTGGVLGTKFVWPDPGPKFKPVMLTSEKETHWKKWIALYNEKMLSRGEFRDLYMYGYAAGDSAFNGEIELRGLKPGTYHVSDYVDGKDFGTVTAQAGAVPKLKAEFKEHLLVEVTPH